MYSTIVIYSLARIILQLSYYNAVGMGSEIESLFRLVSLDFKLICFCNLLNINMSLKNLIETYFAPVNTVSCT